MRCNPIEESRLELQQRLVDLEVRFEQRMQDLFYKKRRDVALFYQDIDHSYPQLQLFVEIARIELAQHKRQRRALLVADQLLAKHFIEKYPTSAFRLRLARDRKTLVNLIISRLVQRACEEDPNVEQQGRRKIYLLVRTYDMLTDVKYHARSYYLRLRDMRYLAEKSMSVVEQATERFKEDVFDQMSEEEVIEVLDFVDVLVAESEAEFDDSSDQQVSELIDKVQRDIDETAREAQRRALASSAAMDGLQLDRLAENLLIEQVSGFERSTIQSAIGFPTVQLDLNTIIGEMLHEAEWRTDRLDWEFKDFIRIYFHYCPWRMFNRAGANYLDALSGLMAKSCAQMYAIEKRMLSIMHESLVQYFVDATKRLPESLVDNSHLIELIFKRSIKHAFELGWSFRTGRLRKEIYLLLKKNEGRRDHHRMANRFYEILNKQIDLDGEAEDAASRAMQRYIGDISFVMPRVQVHDIMLAVDSIINDAVEENNSIVEERMRDEDVDMELEDYMLRQHIGTSLYEKIEKRIQRARASGLGCSEYEIDSVNAREMVKYEYYAAPSRSAGTSQRS